MALGCIYSDKLVCRQDMFKDSGAVCYLVVGNFPANSSHPIILFCLAEIMLPVFRRFE